MKRPTLRDIALQVGVSTTAVSYVLNGKGSVGPEMSQRIRTVAKKLGYRANQAAKATRTGETRSIGLILPDLTNPFFPRLAQSIQLTARQAGYAVFLIDSHENVEWERMGAEDLFARGVDGVIWCPATEKDALGKLDPEVPIVVVDRPLANYDAVSADNYGGARQMADLVLAEGHHSIGMVTGPLRLTSARTRREGFMDRFCEAGTVIWEVENPFSIELCAATLKALQDEAASVIVCGNDLIALGVMQHLYKQGKQVPHDVSVVGFDDISWASFSTPDLTTVSQPFVPLGRAAFDLLLRRIRGDNSPRLGVSLDMQLASRGSLRRLPA